MSKERAVDTEKIQRRGKTENWAFWTLADLRELFQQGRTSGLPNCQRHLGQYPNSSSIQNQVLLRKRETACWGSCLLIYFISSCLPICFITFPKLVYETALISLWIFPWLWGMSCFTLTPSNLQESKASYLFATYGEIIPTATFRSYDSTSWSILCTSRIFMC